MGRRALRAGVAVAFATATLGGGAIAHADSEVSGWMVARTDWTANGTNMHVYAEAWYHNFGCGVKDCATVENLYFQAGRLRGKDTSNAARVNARVGFGGVGLNVYVSFPPSGSFYDAGSSCDHGWWDGDRNWVAVELGTGKVCETNTIGWVSNVNLTASGGLRFGGTWNVRSASRTKSVGGLF